MQLDAMWYGQKGGGGVRKTEINMEFKKQENVWIS